MGCVPRFAGESDWCQPFTQANRSVSPGRSWSGVQGDGAGPGKDRSLIALVVVFAFVLIIIIVALNALWGRRDQAGITSRVRDEAAEFGAAAHRHARDRVLLRQGDIAAPRFVRSR